MAQNNKDKDIKISIDYVKSASSALNLFLIVCLLFIIVILVGFAFTSLIISHNVVGFLLSGGLVVVVVTMLRWLLHDLERIESKEG